MSVRSYVPFEKIYIYTCIHVYPQYPAFTYIQYVPRYPLELLHRGSLKYQFVNFRDPYI